MDFFIIISITMFCLLPIFIGGTLGICSRWRNEYKEQQKELEKQIDYLEKELKTQEEYVEERLFLEKFKWEDIKNEKLRKEIKQKVNRHAENLFMYSVCYSPTQELIDRVAIIKEALEKDKEITEYIEKENKIKRSIKK